MRACEPTRSSARGAAPRHALSPSPPAAATTPAGPRPTARTRLGKRASSTRSACASTASTCPIRLRAGGRQKLEIGPGEATTKEEFEEAQEACSKHMEDIEPPELSEEEQQELKDAALAHARCMREHGIENFPDPTFGENGAAPDPDRRGQRHRPRGPGLPGGRGGLRGRCARPGEGPSGAARRREASRASWRPAPPAWRVAVAAARWSAADGGEGAGATAGEAAARPPPPRSSAATSSIARRSTARSATPTRRRCRAGAAGTLTAIREPGSLVRRGQLALRRRRRAGRLAALRLAPGVARLRARDERRRGRPPARAQPARAGRRPGRRHDRRRRVDVGDDRGGAALPGRPRAHRGRHAREGRDRVPRGRVPRRRGEDAGRQRGGARAPSCVELTSTRREVTVDLEADRQELVRAGDAVTVELPDGATARGRVTDVGKVATQPASEDAEPTIAVTIALRGRAGRGTGLDQAPVDVGFASARAQGRARRAGDRAAGPQRRWVRGRGGRRRRPPPAGAGGGRHARRGVRRGVRLRRCARACGW